MRLFQQRFGIGPVDGWAGRDTLAKLDELAPPKAETTSASLIPDDHWPMRSKIESGDRPYIKAGILH